MAEQKQFIDAAGGQEIAKGAMSYTDKKVGEVNKNLEGYQPKGDYALESDLENYQPKGDYALESALGNYQPKGDYALESALDNYQPKGDYATKNEIPNLEGYAKTSEVSESITSAIAASEKKIFGDGQLAEAFDTIKEIGDYLENHDDVAAGLTAEIGKKVDTETYNADKATFETKEEAASTYQPKGDYALKSELPADYLTDEDIDGLAKTTDVESMLEDYAKEEDLPTAVPVATIQGWFNN